MTIALCFLTVGDLTQPALWEAFLSRGPAATVYCHPKFPEAIATPFLRAGIIGERVPTRHGSVSLVEATLNLYRAAFQDSRNTHFILLSESTIPIVPLDEVARGLSACEGKSLIPFRIPKPGSEHFARQKSLAPGCAFTPFFAHDQWVILSRAHVALLMERPLLSCFGRMFAADEHYILNALVHHGRVTPADVENRRTTFVNWKDNEVKEMRDATGGLLRRTIHPKTYGTLSAGEVLAAREDGCWFFRKVNASCDCGDLAGLVS
jgi:hypothetical protein